MSDAVERDGVWVYTRDPATVERVARAICTAQFNDVGAQYVWQVQFEDGKEEYRAEARMVLAALEES